MAGMWGWYAMVRLRVERWVLEQCYSIIFWSLHVWQAPKRTVLFVKGSYLHLTADCWSAILELLITNNWFDIWSKHRMPIYFSVMMAASHAIESIVRLIKGPFTFVETASITSISIFVKTAHFRFHALICYSNQFILLSVPAGQTTLSTTTTLLPPVSCTVLGPHLLSIGFHFCRLI